MRGIPSFSENVRDPGTKHFADLPWEVGDECRKGRGWGGDVCPSDLGGGGGIKEGYGRVHYYFWAASALLWAVLTGFLRDSEAERPWVGHAHPPECLLRRDWTLMSWL